MSYILFIIVFTTKSQFAAAAGPPSSMTTAEFWSREACEAARVRVTQQIEYQSKAFCIEKGKPADVP